MCKMPVPRGMLRRAFSARAGVGFNPALAKGLLRAFDQRWAEILQGFTLPPVIGLASHCRFWDRRRLARCKAFSKNRCKPDETAANPPRRKNGHKPGGTAANPPRRKNGHKPGGTAANPPRLNNGHNPGGTPANRPRRKNGHKPGGTPAWEPVARQRRAGFQPRVRTRREADGCAPWVSIDSSRYAEGVQEPRKQEKRGTGRRNGLEMRDILGKTGGQAGGTRWKWETSRYWVCRVMMVTIRVGRRRGNRWHGNAVQDFSPGRGPGAKQTGAHPGLALIVRGTLKAYRKKRGDRQAERTGNGRHRGIGCAVS
ncbi:hypothetical protein APED_03420 [Acanthopleuribacter pedis]